MVDFNLKKNAILAILPHESRLVYGSPRIAVAELFLFARPGQNSDGQGFRERAGARGYCLFPFKASRKVSLD